MFSDWISDYNQIIQWAGIVSVFLFFLSLFLLRYVILRLPEDYFITASSIRKVKKPSKDYRQSCEECSWVFTYYLWNNIVVYSRSGNDHNFNWFVFD